MKNTALSKNMFKGNFIVPDYCKDFVCKLGDCRDSCCQGWTVTIPQEQYYKLHGLDCKKSVKDKIDRTFKPLLNPTPERYAEIIHNYQGECPLHKDDGKCLLHETCGEDALPWVCRYYPRGPRIDYANEASCSNSCEKTLELLFSNDNKISFELKELKFLLQPVKLIPSEEQREEYSKIRDDIFKILTDRSSAIYIRIIDVYLFLQNNVHEENSLSHEDSHIYSFIREINDAINYPRLNNLLDKSLQIYEGDNFKTLFEAKRIFFNNHYNNWENMFEKMLMNDMFFKQYPYQKNMSKEESAFALVATYIILRVIVISLIDLDSTKEDLIDILSTAYTVISHSSFDKQVAAKLKSLHQKKWNIFSLLAQIS